MSRNWAFLVFAAAACFFAACFLYPIAASLQGAMFDQEGKFTLGYIAEIFRNPIYVEGLINSFLLAVCSTALCCVIAIPLAVLADRFSFPGKTFVSALILVPMILPPFVGAIGIRQILGQQGVLNAVLVRIGLMDPDSPLDWLGQGKFWGVVILNALHLYPILYLNLAAALANIDPAMEEAAENLGCTGFRKFRRITLPLVMPGLFAGGTIVFIWAFTELGVPLMTDYTRVTSVQIFQGIKEIGGNPMPYALVVVMLFFSAGLYGLTKLLFGRTAHAMTSKGGTGAGPRRARPWEAALCISAFAIVAFLSILPHLGVVFVSLGDDWYASILPREWTLDHFRAALGHELTVPAIRNSLRYASLATLVDVVLGIAIAYVVVRTSLPGRHLLDAMAMLPLAVPGLVLAFGYLAMTQKGQWFDFLDPTANPTALLVIAYSVRRMPYVVRSAVAGFQQTSVSLEEAAQNLGATPLRALRRITLPLIAANLLAGGILAFSFAMLEVSDSLLLAQKEEHYPITKAIFELTQLLGEGRYAASALGVWAMAFLGATLLCVTILLGKKLGTLFRA
jgi:iron(III) transport system permease protein